jgi:hypothetical protein
LINDYCHGRVRHRRPGLCMCPSAFPPEFAGASRPRRIPTSIEDIRAPVGFQGNSRSERTPAFAGWRGGKEES